jgi:hypothetical protein
MDLIRFLNQNQNLIINICTGITTGTVTGIIAGLISAELYRRVAFKRSKKVEIIICDYAIKRFKKNNIPVLQVKIKNNSPKDLAGIEVKIFGIEYFDSEKYHQNRTLLAQKHLDFLPKYDNNDKKCNYFYVPALHSTTSNIHEEIEKYDDILILVKAIDYYDNNIVIKEKIIDKNNIKDNHWSFENCKCSTSKRNDIKSPENIKIPFEEVAKNCPFIKKQN